MAQPGESHVIASSTVCFVGAKSSQHSKEKKLVPPPLEEENVKNREHILKPPQGLPGMVWKYVNHCGMGGFCGHETITPATTVNGPFPSFRIPSLPSVYDWHSDCHNG